MELKKLEYDLTICKVDSLADVDLTADFFFIAQTDEELSRMQDGRCPDSDDRS